MKKTLLPLALVAALALPAGAETFEVEENFDVDASFSQGGELPDGWSQTGNSGFKRNTGAAFGLTAKSGQYVIGSAAVQAESVIYTSPVELAGGAQAAIEFQALMPGGTPAAVRNWGFTIFAGKEADIATMKQIGQKEPAAVSDWKKFTYKFTPTEDGEYYYAIRIDKGQLDLGGFVLLDSFFFSGEKIDQQQPWTGDPASTYEGMDLLAPDEDNASLCQEIPMFENFSDGSHFDGTSFVPVGWLSTGTDIWRAAAKKELHASSGDWYLVTLQTNLERDERVYTPFFQLEKGVTYTLSFDVHQEGTQVAEDDFRISTINVLAGTQQDRDFMPVKMLSISEESLPGRWGSHKVTLCPKVSGPYCFCFELEGLPYSGMAAIDNVRLTSPVDLARPEPGFSAQGIYNIMNSHLLSMNGLPVRIVNTAVWADEIEWDTDGVEYNVLPNGDIDFFPDMDGDFNITQTVTNGRGTRSTQKVVKMQIVGGQDENMGLLPYDPESSYAYPRSAQLKFPTDPLWDFVSGPNHYYTTYAEYFPVPETAKFEIRSVGFWLSWLNYWGPIGDDNLKPVRVAFYSADKDGLIDEQKCIYSYDSTMAEIFGYSGTNEINGRDIEFPQPFEVEGPFYMVMEYPKNLVLEAPDQFYDRTYVSLQQVRHEHGRSTFYVKPDAVPEGSKAQVGKWCNISELDPSLKSLGTAYTLWCSYLGNDVALTPEGITTVSARNTGDTALVLGTEQGDWIAVYNAGGQCVATLPAAQGETTFSTASFAPGVYVVSTARGAVRFVK